MEDEQSKIQLTSSGMRKLIVLIYFILFALFFLFYKLQVFSSGQLVVLLIVLVTVIGLILAGVSVISKRNTGTAGQYIDTRSKSRIVFDWIRFLLWAGGIFFIGFFVLLTAVKQKDKYGAAVGIIALIMFAVISWAVVSMIRISKKQH